MRFSIPLVAFALGVAALPAADVDAPANIVADIQTPYDHPPQVDGGEMDLTRIAASDKRSVAVEAVEDTLAKRATIIIDVYQDNNGGGRHQGLYTDTQVCYNLGNGWNDVISSLYVPSGYGCDFYVDGNCGGDHLNVGGNLFYTSLGWINDRISAYRCYN